SLWCQKGYVLNVDFLRRTEQTYRAALKEVDYEADYEESRKTINRWVEHQTKGRIKGMLSEPDVTPKTRLVLTNAMCTKANWAFPFSKDETKDAAFNVSPSEKITIPMMQHRRSAFRYYGDDHVQWLELPYRGDRLSMIIMLPTKKGQLTNLESSL